MTPTPTLAGSLAPVRATLDNGAVVVVQETSATPAVAINATFLAGSLYEPADLPGLAYLTGRVIDRGTERRSADVIAEELDERGISLRVATTRHTMTLSCTCLAEDFNDVLAIVMDVARRPVFPDRELAKRRAEAITAVRQDEDNPAVRAVEGLSELLYGVNHPYGRRAKGTVESLERIDREAIVRLPRPTTSVPRCSPSRSSATSARRTPSIERPPSSTAGQARRQVRSSCRPRSFRRSGGCA